MELEDAREMAYELMSDFGLYYWKFEFDYSKRRFGLCDGVTKTISLSKPLVLLNDKYVVEHVILHEIAHALVGARQGHNHLFQQKAREIGCEFTQRYLPEDVNPVPKNVIAICPNCGKKSERYRMPSKKYSCGKCSEGKFNEKYLLVYKRTPQV
jgi:hypothetical protein